MRGLEHLAELALTQLKEVLDAYATRSADLGQSIRERDEEIDAIYTSLFRELLTYMMEDPRNITACTHLLFCAKNIERIGDHATNIAETVYYMATGAQLAAERPKDDDGAETVACRRVTGLQPGDHEHDPQDNGRRRRRGAERPAALQSRGRRLRGRYVTRGDEAEIRPAGAGARPADPRLDAAGPFRHRVVPAAAHSRPKPSACRSSC